MDVEGGRVVHRERRARKLSVVVAVQNVLVVACLLVTLYVYWDVQRQTSEPPEDDVHIQLRSSGKSGNGTLQFNEIRSKYKMNATGDKISVTCTGPYILYMNVSFKNLDNNNGNGTLELRVDERKTPVSSFKLQTSSDNCRGLYSIAYLRANEQAHMYLNATSDFKITDAIIDLSYLLRRCYD